MEQKNDDRIERMREEMDNKLEAILKEVKSNKTTSTVTNPRSKINEIQNSQPSGFKTNRSIRSIGLRASNIEHSDSENDDYPLRASKMKDLKHHAKLLFQNESDVDITILSNEKSDVEYYHMVTGANRQLHRQNPQNQNDTIGSHVDQNLSNPTTRSLDPVNQIALAIEKLAYKTPHNQYSILKTRSLSMG